MGSVGGGAREGALDLGLETLGDVWALIPVLLLLNCGTLPEPCLLPLLD